MSAMLAIAVAIIAWWVSTGAVILLARMGERHAGMVMAVATAIALAGLYALDASLDDTTPSGAYLGFFGALGLWAWHETAFLLGIVTGPRRIAYRQHPMEPTRFRAAFLAVRDHELALAATALALLVLMGSGDNRTGLYTFLLMWVMRLSAKVNIFLGAPHAISDMLPERLGYLKSYFCTERINPFFWVSVTVTALLFAGLCAAAAFVGDGHATVMWCLLAAFAGLALVEHFFLVLPVRDSMLWAWAMASCPVQRQDQSRDTRKAEPESAGTIENRDNEGHAPRTVRHVEGAVS
ncbi:MAG: DUF3623 domain-containing protein [Nitratireductor sp.]|nr:DUF3623 domain-containing protein [Nitratireductor sp.]